MANIIFIDNFDSFTYNLVEQVRSLGHLVTVYRNHIDASIIVSKIQQLENPVIMLSPGPGVPSDAGCMLDLIVSLKGIVPIIGICLGYQAIVEAYGGLVGLADEVMHGKTSIMKHNNHPIYQAIPSPMAVARYHSLMALCIPDQLTVTAVIDNCVMSVVCEEDKVCGFQFHPESIMTTYGASLLSNTLQWVLIDRSQ